MAIQEHSKSRGLSWLIHNDVKMQHKYQIKGKMGVSLNILQQGTHIAFAGGITGIIAFIDLIGHMVLSLIAEYNISKIQDCLNRSKNKINKNDFKLILYLQKVNSEDEIGSELIKILENLCTKYSKPIFEVKKSEEPWDTQFFKQKIWSGIKNHSKKIWISADPQISENFDKGSDMVDYLSRD